MVESRLRKLPARWRSHISPVDDDDTRGQNTAWRECAIAVDDFLFQAESILAAPQAAPAGMVLVPRELTEDMENAWFGAPRTHDEKGKPNFQAAYAAMLAAAPAAQVAVNEGWQGPVDREQLANWIHRKMTDLAVEYRNIDRFGEDLRMVVGGMIPVYYAPPEAAAPAVVVDEAMVERAGMAMERANHPQWTDAEFDTWWNRDSFFCERRTAWNGFQGTRKEKVLWEARNALAAALGQGKA
ncbi:hypothetical protein [Lysobacter capsici]|uniref:hypothetical protein n=1 Tax=Lysobacter capsici TaxID=435897 RepID=UPI00398CF67C